MSLDVGLLAKGLEADQRADRIDAWRKWGRGKIRRVRTPEGARFYGAPIGTPIVADPKTGKLKAAASDVAWDLYPTEDPLTFSKIRRVRTPEGAKFYNAPIGTPIVADKATGKLRALTTAKLPQAPLLKDWKPGDPTDRIKAQITDVVRGVLDEAGLPEGTLTVSVKPASTLSKLTVAVRYSRPDDYKKASVALHRQIYPSERKVHNWQFSVAKDLQGHGIGAKMTAALEDLWRSEGIETVTVGANADVGGYAWARLGFEFKDPAQAAEFVSDAQKQITKYAPIWAKKVSPEYVEDVKAQVQALQERLDAGDTILPAEIAMLGYREGLDDPPFYWLGKRVLLGTSWDGVKDLGRPKVQMVKTKRTKQTSEPLPDAFWDAFDADAEDFQMPEQAKAEPEQEEGWGPHRPAGPDYGSPLWAVDAGIYPSDIYTDFRAVDYYGSGDPDGYRRDSSMVDRIRRMQGRPTREVKIYRAIPKDAKSQWREGDWVTMERSYAVEHGRSALNGDYKIISKTVPAYTLWTEGNSLQEWGYHPEASEPKIAYKDDFARWFARARKENPGLSRQDAWEQWKAEQITTDPEQGTILAQRTSKIRTDRKIPVSDPLTVQDIQRLAALEDEDPQRYFDLLDEDVQDRLWEAAQKSPVGRASDPVWRDWWYHRFEAEDLPPKPPRGRWTVQEGEYPDTETRLRNESGDTILSEVPLTERQQQLLVQDFDFLLSKVPPSTFENVKHGHLGLVIPAQDGTFGADKVEGVDWNTFGAINGYVIDKIPVINLNPELLNRIEPTSGPYSGPHGYGFEITNSLRGVMAHEMGHVIDFANGHTASQSQQDWQQVIDTAYGVILNEHTRKDPQETYAELFGMWVMGFKDYDTGLLDKYAQQFGWEQPDDAVLTLSREDEVRSKVRSVQKVKDTLTDIDVGLRTGVRARIEKAVGDYFAYARQIGINNPMLSPAEVFARADVQALWAQEAASLHSWLANRISEGFYKGADLGRSGDAHGVLDEGYLDAVNQDLTNYLATLDSQVRSAVWNAYNQIDWVPSYAQGGTSTNVPHDTAVKRWDTASDSQSAVVTDISRRAHAGISAATHRGYTEGQLSTITDTSMLKMWVANFAQPPERGPCLTCIALHGMTIPVTEQFPAEVTYAAKPLGVYRDLLGPPRHPNCFPADTLVQAPDRELGFVRYYEGPMVRVTLLSGEVLTATPNHPVLTSSRGWQPIGSLTPGNDLCRYEGNVVDGRSDVQEVPARIVDVIMALSEEGHTVTEGAAGDFHGDGSNGEVHVVGADSELLFQRDVLVAQCGHQFVLVGGDTDTAVLVAQGASGSDLETFGLGTSGFIGSGNEGSAALGGSLGHASKHGGAAATYGDSSFSEPAIEYEPRNLIAEAERLFGSPGEIVADRVVEVVWDWEWAGHVYNLQTTKGWYVANGYVTGNCRCKLVFFAAGQEHEPVSKKMNEYAMDVVTSTMATTGFTAKQVRALPEPLFERLWRFLMRGGWWKRLWKRLRSG